MVTAVSIFASMQQLVLLGPSTRFSSWHPPTWRQLAAVSNHDIVRRLAVAAATCLNRLDHLIALDDLTTKPGKGRLRRLRQQQKNKGSRVGLRTPSLDLHR